MTFLSDRIVGHLRDVATQPALDDGRYHELRLIGAGGMGRVFSARDTLLGRDVAIKVSHSPAAGSELDARLRREAEVLARLEHPGIVPVHDVGIMADGRVFYVMKLVQGRTLSDEATHLGTESARLGAFERIVEAVAFAHAQGVVHRDIKPANVMVGRFGEVLVMDWGVARMVDMGVEPGLARVGTPGFMAPEQERPGVEPLGPAADVFALGALLRWLLNGQPRMSKRLRAIIAKCMNPAAAERYPDASALAADLARYRAGVAVDALPESPLDRFVRFASAHATIILLITAYLVMRVVVAFVQQT